MRISLFVRGEWKEGESEGEVEGERKEGSKGGRIMGERKGKKRKARYEAVQLPLPTGLIGTALVPGEVNHELHT